MANVPTVSHNEGTPGGSDYIRDGDDRIVEFKTQVREIVAVDHKMDSSGQGAGWGQHKKVTLQVSTAPSALANTSVLGSVDVDSVAETFVVREDGKKCLLSKRIRTLVWHIASDIAADTDASARLYVPFAGTITTARMWIKTAPTGANLIVDIHLNGTTIWATQGNRVTITAGNNTGSQTTFDTTAVSIDDYFSVDVDQVGSTVTGADLTIMLDVVEYY